MSLEAKGIRKSKGFLGSTREPVQGEGGGQKVRRTENDEVFSRHFSRSGFNVRFGFSQTF